MLEEDKKPQKNLGKSKGPSFKKEKKKKEKVKINETGGEQLVLSRE
jgi:hypothetical protein